MIKIAKILMDEFGITEADNPDGTDNDGGEKVLPSDVQHGMKSKIVSPNIINPMMQSDAEDAQNNEELQELRLPDNNDVEGKETQYKYSFKVDYNTIINNNKICVIITKSKDEISDVVFTVNDELYIQKTNINPMKVYQYVISCILDYIKKYNPIEISFSPFTNTHQQNYNVLLKLLSKDINNFGYEVIKDKYAYYIKKVDSDLEEMKRFAGLN